MARKPRNPLGVKQHNAEVREAAGLQDRLLSDLKDEELQELAATWMFEGYDAVKDKYGLSRGEVLALFRMPSWLQIAKVAASNMRAQVVMRTMLAIPRLTALLEAKVADSSQVMDAVEALRLIKEMFAELAGSAPTTVTSGSAEPAQIAQDEMQALSKLNEHLRALTDAKLVSETPRRSDA